MRALFIPALAIGGVIALSGPVAVAATAPTPANANPAPDPNPAAVFSGERRALIDRPFQGESIALSPAGTHLAYTLLTEGRLSLRIDHLPAKSSRIIPLQLLNRTTSETTALRELRWVSNQRLIVQAADGRVAALNADGTSPLELWDPDSDGLINRTYLIRAGFLVTPEPPRLLPAVPDDPGHILLESSARIGAEVFSNVHRIDVLTGETELAHPSMYARYQIALFGPGALIFQAPPRPGAADPSDPNAAFDAAADTFFANPEDGGPNNPDSSSTGRMLYDRQGRPRILHEQSPISANQPFSYTEAGQPPMEANIVTRSLDRVLEQRAKHEFEISGGNYFGERSYPLGFDYDPDVLYYASNVGRDTFGVFSLNLKTRERTPIAAPETTAFDLAPLEPDYPGSPLVFDDQARRLVGIRYNGLHPSTLWLDPELAQIQQGLAAGFRAHHAEILHWSDDRQKFLVRMASAEDPGAYFILNRADNSVDLALLRAPWLKDTAIHASAAIAFQTPAGTKLTGWITLPSTPKLTPPPLLIYCQGGLWDGDAPSFSREAQLLADLGIAVMRVNYRGSAGHGRAHLNALHDGVDTVPLEDILASVDWISARYKIDRARIIIMGEGFGGYLALRALQLNPEVFRGAIALNAPTNLTAWASERPRTGLKPMKADPLYDINRPVPYDFHSVVRSRFFRGAKKGSADGDNPSRPLLVIEDPKSPDLTPISTGIARLLGLGVGNVDLERLGISGQFEGGTDETRTRVFRRIEEFLNSHLYDFSSSFGELKVLEDAPAPAKK